jgi:hypothetical protein
VRAYLTGCSGADAEDVAEGDIDMLVTGDVHSGDTSHTSLLPLPLLVTGVAADHAHHSSAAHDLAVIAATLY